ncbi:insulinase family protein [Pontibacter qinzhouensis]|uniref:Insulinase family protein n=1 Tax=Pontibacter qinzhouensis TaxID=2603253 RepID=A0A5C8KCK2_9BACT|nr:insulinase family protein [Pontibacter qinzhouensis]TXK51982.1 insulinase family protein [Pontibacter qinzhouensis]
MRKTYHLLLLLLVVVSTAKAQTRQTPPEPGPAPKIELGKYESFTLKNGLKVYVVENHKVPVVSMSLVLDRDPILEGEKAGYVSAAGQMMRTGTKSRSKDELDEAVDFIGAELSFTSTGFSASSLTKHLPTLLNLSADALLNPDFKQEELDKVKKQMLASLAQEKDNPDAIARKVRQVLLFGKNHPYGEQMTEQTVESFTLADVQNYYSSYFKPNIAYLAVVGDVKAKEVKKLLNKSAFKNWQKGEVKQLSYPLPQKPAQTEVVIVDRPSAVQTSLALANPADLKPGSPESIPTQLMNNILGGSSTARLFMNLREKHGYTYGAYSSVSSDKLLGYFAASGNVRNAVTDSAVVEFKNELSRIRSEQVSEQELKDAKAYMTGSFARGLENPNTVAFYAINTARYNLPKDYYANYLKKVEAVTVADVQRMAQKHITPDQLYIIAVGNASDIATKLEPFDSEGGISYYNTSGDKLERSTAASLPAGLTAEAVLTNYVQALGGKANIDKLKDVSIISSATMQGTQLQFVQQQKSPDKYHVAILMNNNPMQKVTINGSKGKMEAPMQGVNQEIPADQLNTQLLEAAIFGVLLYDKLGIKTELKGLESIDSKEAYAIEAKQPNGQRTTNYFDKESGLLVKTINSIQSPQGVITQTRSYKNYKEVNGIKFPHAVETSFGPQTIKTEVQSVEVNKGISDDVFKL